MVKFFDIDGVLYKTCHLIYILLVGNILWFIFSIPIFTIGSSTTALYYVMSKSVSGNEVKIISSFWKSFKINFKQSTLIWITLLLLFFFVSVNMYYVKFLNNSILAIIIYFIQIVVLVQLIIFTMYIFYILSKYSVNTKKLIVTAVVIGNKHFVNTILCAMVFGGIILVFVNVPYLRGIIGMTFMALYAYCSAYFLNRLMKKYEPVDEMLQKDETKANVHKD